MPKEENYAAGMRVVIRDAEWLVKKVVHAKDGSRYGQYELTCVGISNLVRGEERRFLSAYEDDILVLEPEETRLVADGSKGYRRSKLFIESLLRRTPPTDAKIHVAHKAAMDVHPYQLKPAREALEATRPRILIADAVGIGKTLEAGVLVSELIARGRGKRILVLTVKAMLEQFQKEFWNRFSIPLMRLDSDGLQRLMQRIPSGHNPFLYVDRSIVSIDTLKQGTLYRDLLEGAYWDIILIDEAHNVAERGSRSQRSQLARLLSQRSDALIMLSATPHDGRPESFASLIDMLDPTVLPDKRNYTAEDIRGKGLFIRRFKGDVKNEVSGHFPERSIGVVRVEANASENAVFRYLEEMRLLHIDRHRQRGNALFKTTLMKVLFSSPSACLSTVEKRLQKLRKTPEMTEAIQNDVLALEGLRDLLTPLTPAKRNSKFQALVGLLKGTDGSDYGWNRRDAEDRLVIFTESRVTLDWLREHLPAALGLKEREVVVLKGDDGDRDLMDAVETFNKKDSPVRLMLATDVASEGLNLHRFCHRLIHFDIPWSLMTFQQRNGRVDRYGQEKRPIIRYLQTMASESLKAFGDARILEALTEKDENAHNTIADPREFGLSAEEQEARTVAEMQGELDPEEGGPIDWDDPMAFLMGSFEDEEPKDSSASEDDVRERDLLFPGTYEFVREAVRERNDRTRDAEERAHEALTTEMTCDDARRSVTLQPDRDLDARLDYLPREVLPEDRRFRLTDDPERIQRAIREAASNPHSTWPAEQLLWELHPVTQWVEDWAIGSFGRHAAPVLRVEEELPEDEVWVLMQGGYPNRKGYAPVHDWSAVRLHRNGYELLPRRALMEKVFDGRELINDGREPDEELKERLAALLPKCVEKMRRHLAERKGVFGTDSKERMDEKLLELDRLRSRHMTLFDEAELPVPASASKAETERENRRRDVERAFENARQYVEDVWALDDTPYVQVVAVLTGRLSGAELGVERLLD